MKAIIVIAWFILSLCAAILLKDLIDDLWANVYFQNLSPEKKELVLKEIEKMNEMWINERAK